MRAIEPTKTATVSKKKKAGTSVKRSRLEKTVVNSKKRSQSQVKDEDHEWTLEVYTTTE